MYLLDKHLFCFSVRDTLKCLKYLAYSIWLARANIFCCLSHLRYQGQVGVAPATYLKKSSDPYARSLVEKSRHSGVQIIGTLADVSNLMTHSSTTPHNAGIFSTPASGARNTAAKPLEDQAKVSKNPEKQEEMDVVGKMQLQIDSHAQRQSQIVIKQRSLERGGNLKPPPRQNSVQARKISLY